MEECARHREGLRKMSCLEEQELNVCESKCGTVSEASGTSKEWNAKGKHDEFVERLV